MKLLIISDTHGYIANAVSVIEETKPDYVIHLGDVADDCDQLKYIYPMQKMICVLGNNDWYNRQYPLEIITTLNGKKFFICHGHKYNVKYGTELVKKKGISEKADVILYGHTHRRFIEEKDGLLIMNPGSTASYGIINIDEKGTITADILEV